MSVIPITCDNCGAKYKLPPTFKGTQAKCQKCGSVIDVQKQREAAGDDDSPAAKKPAAARPAAAAKPAVDRSKSRAATGGRAAAASRADKPARGGSSRSRRDAKDDDGEDTPRRGREKKKDNTPMIIGGVGLVAIIVVVAVMMMGGNEKTGEETAGTTPAANGTDATKPVDANGADGKPADTNAAGAAKPEEGSKPEEPVEVAKPEEGTKPAEGDAKKPDTPAPPPVEAGLPNTPKEPWQKQRNPPQTMSEVQSAAEMYGEVQWPDSIDAATKAEIMDIVDDLSVSGGIRSIRAKAKLVKAGYAGLFGILEALQKLDYRQSADAAFGFELNKALEDITGGLNARYAAVQADETMHPAKALWNTKTVKAWMATFAKWPDEDAFKQAKAERAKKKG